LAGQTLLLFVQEAEPRICFPRAHSILNTLYTMSIMILQCQPIQDFERPIDASGLDS